MEWENLFGKGRKMPNDVVDLANMIYGEVANQDYNTMLKVGSTAINRLNSNRPREFGSNMQEVLQKGYYAVSNPNEPYQEAISGKFKSKEGENKYKQALAIASGLKKGTITPTKGVFYFTPKEIQKLKKNKKAFNFDLVEQVGETPIYKIYDYKGGE